MLKGHDIPEGFEPGVLVKVIKVKNYFTLLNEVGIVQKILTSSLGGPSIAYVFFKNPGHEFPFYVRDLKMTNIFKETDYETI